MSRRDARFSSVRTEGGLLPQDVLSRIQTGDKDLAGLDPQSYHLGPHERVGEAVNRSWSRLSALWHNFQDALAKESDTGLATGLTRERWLLPLFQELGYGRLPKGQAIEVEGKSFAVSHTWHHSPIHLLGVGVDLDRRQAGVAGAAKASPHGLVQEFLNRSDDHLWGFVTNGYRLRVLRDHYSLTRQAYVEFDLQAIMDGEQYSEFLLLWMVCHQSRVEADKPGDCWLEQWFNTSQEEGVRALDKLRDGVEKAIEAFGTGFLAHRANTALRDALESGELDKQDYYRQVLRLVYRLIFLFVAEERDALFDPNASETERERYLRFYATRRLRDLADRRRGGPHGDLWQGIRLVMSKLHEGCPELALPALGSMLWGPTACPTLMDAECANENVLGAVRWLSSIQEGSTRYHVNWRNVGAEELGSVYEGLLELHPRINHDAGSFELATAAGHERKTTGSYYTHTELVDSLLDAGLEPALIDAGKTADPEAAILNLKICDPACGSGHFLVAAARRIAKRLAAVRAGENEPSPHEVQRALRDVVGRCIYGVDVNPMAVELCKVSLWMEAIEPGRPLSFLDSHIQCGNALLGTTPALLAEGIPNDAFNPIEGDDRKIASALKKRNGKERKSKQLGFVLTPAVDVSIVEEFVACDGSADSDLAAVREHEACWLKLKRSHSYRDAQFRADAWCSAFVWPKEQGELGNAAFTEQDWQLLQTDATALGQAVRKTVRQLAGRYRFFHWHLAFPQVFAADEGKGGRWGFDVVLGNPPWETLSPDAKEFFSSYDPAVREMDKQGQSALIESLLVDDEVARKWKEYRRDLYASVHFMKTSGRNVLFAEGHLGKGDFNSYRMFIETALTICRNKGWVAQIVPEGLYNGANAAAIRRHLLFDCEWTTLLGCQNLERRWFPAVYYRTRFAVFSARTGGRTETLRAAFNVTSGAHLDAFRQGDALRVSPNLVAEFSPDALAIMDFGSQRDIDIASRLYERHPKFGDERAGPPHRHYMREVDMGNDRDLFTEDPSGVPVYEGRMVSQFDHRAKGYRSGRGRKAVWEDLQFSDATKSIQPQWHIPQAKIPDKAEARYRGVRIGFCDVASPTNERSLVAALIPAKCICGHKVPTITFESGELADYPIWLAVANSFAMDFLVRMKVSLSMTFTILDSMPFPRQEVYAAHAGFLVPRVLRLTCTGPELNDFWNAMGAAGLVDAYDQADGVPGSLDERERAQLKAELDAYVARLIYGLTRDELAYVLDTFPIVKKRDVKAFGDYRTKLMVLDAYDRLDEAKSGDRSPMPDGG